MSAPSARHAFRANGRGGRATTESTARRRGAPYETSRCAVRPSRAALATLATWPHPAARPRFVDRRRSGNRLGSADFARTRFLADPSSADHHVARPALARPRIVRSADRRRPRALAKASVADEEPPSSRRRAPRAPETSRAVPRSSRYATETMILAPPSQAFAPYQLHVRAKMKRNALLLLALAVVAKAGSEQVSPLWQRKKSASVGNKKGKEGEGKGKVSCRGSTPPHLYADITARAFAADSFMAWGNHRRLRVLRRHLTPRRTSRLCAELGEYAVLSRPQCRRDARLFLD